MKAWNVIKADIRREWPGILCDSALLLVLLALIAAGFHMPDFIVWLVMP